MNEKRANLEVIAPSVEEAIARGLADLGLPEEAVDIEILDTGTRGLFGLGTRQARVRLSIKLNARENPGDSAPTLVTRAPASILVELEDSAQAVPESASAIPPEPLSGVEEEVSGEVIVSLPAEDLEEANLAALEVARQVVGELVAKMHVHAQVTAIYGEPDEPNNRPPLMVNIEGKDLSILIGPRAETLNALQYISSLIIGKQLEHSVPLVVDVEGYRQRRSREVRLLARRMAEQAVRTGRRQYLEPMPANERRLVHIELRDHVDVTTESIGEEPRRKVTVVPKQ